MTHEEQAAEYLWQRDEARAKCARLEAENERFKMPLKYAEEAIEAERKRAFSAGESHE